MKAQKYNKNRTTQKSRPEKPGGSSKR